MEPTETKPVKNHTQRALIFLAISVVILGVVLYTARSRGYLSLSQKNMTESAPTPTPTIIDPNINMRLEGSTSTTQFSKTENVNLNLVASSSTHDIVGYDVLINFDPSFFDVVSTKSLDTRFQAATFKKEGMISVTGTKSPSFSGQAVLKDEDLLNLVLKPKKTGTTTVSIQSMAGAEKTKMINTSSAILTPQLTSITLAIY